MGTFKSLEEVREHFRNDHFATENGEILPVFLSLFLASMIVSL